MTEGAFVPRRAGVDVAGLVASLVSKLLTELGGERAEFRPAHLTPEAAQMLSSGWRFTAILAFDATGAAVVDLLRSGRGLIYGSLEAEPRRQVAPAGAWIAPGRRGPPKCD